MTITSVTPEGIQMNGTDTYIVMVTVPSTESVPTLASQIQAVFDDSSRAPDGMFHLEPSAGQVGVVFTRSFSADFEVIQAAMTPARVAYQLARELSVQPDDAPIIQAIFDALIAQDQAGGGFTKEQAEQQLDALEMSLNGDDTDDETRGETLESIRELEARIALLSKVTGAQPDNAV